MTHRWAVDEFTMARTRPYFEPVTLATLRATLTDVRQQGDEELTVRRLERDARSRLRNRTGA